MCRGVEALVMGGGITIPAVGRCCWLSPSIIRTAGAPSLCWLCRMSSWNEAKRLNTAETGAMQTALLREARGGGGGDSTAPRTPTTPPPPRGLRPTVSCQRCRPQASMGAKGARHCMNTKGASRKILPTLHPNIILKPNLDSNTHPQPSAYS